MGRHKVTAKQRQHQEIMEAIQLTGQERKCKAILKKTGNRCGKFAIKGGLVCPTHGGSAPQVKAKAKARLLEMVEPTITRLQQLIAQSEHLPTALGATTHLLNRALGKPGDSPKNAGSTTPSIVIGIALGGMPLSLTMPPPKQIEDGEEDDEDVIEGEVEDDD